jgi:hypothetical protein
MIPTCAVNQDKIPLAGWVTLNQSVKELLASDAYIGHRVLRWEISVRPFLAYYHHPLVCYRGN